MFPGRIWRNDRGEKTYSIGIAVYHYQYNQNIETGLQIMTDE